MKHIFTGHRALTVTRTKKEKKIECIGLLGKFLATLSHRPAVKRSPKMGNFTLAVYLPAAIDIRIVQAGNGVDMLYHVITQPGNPPTVVDFRQLGLDIATGLSQPSVVM